MTWQNCPTCGSAFWAGNLNSLKKCWCPKCRGRRKTDRQRERRAEKRDLAVLAAEQRLGVSRIVRVGDYAGVPS